MKIYDVVFQALVVVTVQADSKKEAESMIRNCFNSEDGMIKEEISGEIINMDLEQEVVVEKLDENHICEDCLKDTNDLKH